VAFNQQNQATRYALTLSASGFILGPFVYFGHEMVWDYYGSPKVRAAEPEVSALLLPAPG